MQYQFTRLDIPDVILVTLKKFGDSRGFFMETYREKVFTENGIPGSFVQENFSKSNKGILRGLHYQMDPYAQGKLVRVVSGSVLDVAVDIRKGSPTFGRHIAVTLSENEPTMLWEPTGFAHGFAVLEDNTQFSYKTTDYYHPEVERSILWSDPELKINWPDMNFNLSEKDKDALCLKDAENNFIYV